MAELVDAHRIGWFVEGQREFKPAQGSFIRFMITQMQVRILSCSLKKIPMLAHRDHVSPLNNLHMSQKFNEMAQAVEEYIKDSKISQNKLASLIGISPSYIVHILKRNWDNIPAGQGRTTTFSEANYKKVMNFLGLEEAKVWDIENYKLIFSTLLEAKAHKEHRIISGERGAGKTFTAEAFLREHPNETYLITASDDMNPKAFMIALAEQIGVDSTGDRRKIRLAIAAKIKTMSNPLIIVDESENAKPAMYGSIKALFDGVEKYCGIVLIGANGYLSYLKKKADAGRGCFPQLYSRFSADPIELNLMSKADVRMICQMNQINNPKQINDLFDTCKDYRELDRKIKRIIKDSDLSNQSI